MDNAFTNNLKAAGETNLLGTFSHYNSLLFGNIEAVQADCEGALAVGGLARFGSTGHGFDIGGAGLPNTQSVMIGEYKNPNDYPTLLIGGKVSHESTSANAYAGALALRSGYKTEYEAGTFQVSADALRYESDELVGAFFQSAKEKSARTGNVLLNSCEKKISASELQSIKNLNHSQFKGDIAGDKRIQVYTLDCSENASVTINEIDFSSFVNEYDMLVINVPARSVSFANGAILYDGRIIDTSAPRIYEANKLNALLAGKVVFNFPNAETVTLNQFGVIGAVIAPNATVTGNGGSINGMLVAENLTQTGGMELHAFTIALGNSFWELEPNNPCKEVTLIKTNASGELVLEGAGFSLYNFDPESKESKFIGSGSTNAEGILTFAELEAGWYRITESIPPPGYIRADMDEWIFEVAFNKEGVNAPLEIIYITNKLAMGDAVFLKLDYSDRSNLPGAIFSLYLYNEETQTYDLSKENLITDENGSLIIENLVLGKYRLVETQAPTGYYLRDTTYDFAIEQDNDGEVKHFETITILNQHLPSVELTKQDADDDKLLLPGAEFTLSLYNKETGQYDEVETGLTTDENGHLTIEDLEPGSYKLIETAAPEGYYLSPEAEILFEVSLDGDGWIIPPEPITATNKELGKIKFIKVDEDDREIGLEGAEFTLYMFNEEESEYEQIRSGLISGEDGVLLIERLQPGSYKLTETKAPKGYLMPTDPDVTFVITL